MLVRQARARSEQQEQSERTNAFEMCSPYQLHHCSCGCSATVEEATRRLLHAVALLLLLVAVGCGSECPAKLGIF
jgi:hypothetical protein